MPTLHDGTWAAGLFNRGLEPRDVTLYWRDIGLDGDLPVRDLWQQKDLGSMRDRFTTHVPGHGAVMVRIGRPRAGASN